MEPVLKIALKDPPQHTGGDVKDSPPQTATATVGSASEQSCPRESALASLQGICPLELGDGETDPEFNKKIRLVILRDKTFIVYLDEELTTYWWYTPLYEKPEQGALGAVLNRIAALEAIPIGYLSPSNRLAFRRLVAEGVARVLDERSLASATAVLDQAENFVRSRSAEVARGWFALTGLGALGLFGLVALAAHLLADASTTGRPTGPAEFLFAISLGAIGACLSLLARLNTVHLDPAAGCRLHVVECSARVAAGMIGGLLVLLVVKAGLLLPSLDDTPKGVYALFTLCLVAGASERVVPSLIGKIEGKAGTTASGIKTSGPTSKVQD